MRASDKEAVTILSVERRKVKYTDISGCYFFQSLSHAICYSTVKDEDPKICRNLDMLSLKTILNIHTGEVDEKSQEEIDKLELDISVTYKIDGIPYTKMEVKNSYGDLIELWFEYSGE